VKEHTAMIDPLHLGHALDFLGDGPAPRMPLTPADFLRRRYRLEDVAGALEYFAHHYGRPTGPAQVAALNVFELAAVVWREHLSSFAGNFEPDTAALNLHAWAWVCVRDSLHGLPAPLIDTLAQSFPQVGAWAATVYVCGALPLPGIGTAAGYWAVCILAAMTAGPGFEDGEPEDLLDALLSSLEGVGRVTP
jgi:hypothetical protein